MGDDRPVIVAYAGRRASSLGKDPGSVGQRIRRLLAALQPAAVVGAAADGVDLLVLEAALALPDGPAAHLVLPTTRQVFEENSVEPAWRDRFAAVLDEIERRHGEIVTLDLEPGEAAYRRANQAILDRAAELAGDGHRSVALVVAREGEGRMIVDLQHRAGLGDVPVLRIDPTVDLSTAPTCFVAMPYGKKADTERRIDLDCDQVYDKVLVPALEHAQLSYLRGDEEIDSGIVLEPMVEWLSAADLVIGDLQTGNFNVGWELGLRHLLRSGRTLLIGPAGTRAPFDVAAVRHVRYRQDQNGITDDAAIDAWQLLAPHLSVAGDHAANDSPVAAVMEVQQWGQVRRRTIRDDRWETLRQELALARDLRDADQMLSVIQDTHGLGDEQRRLLRAEAGVGLVRLRRFTQAQQLLRDVVAADPGVLRPDAHVYYAQSLYRPPAASRDDLDEAERVLKRVLVKRQGHPEVWALLGAVAKRRMVLLGDDESRQADLQLALTCYQHDVERNLNLYYEGINVVAMAVALALGHGDLEARARAAELLPAVRLAARLAGAKPDERYWAEATVAECALHASLLDPSTAAGAVRAAYRKAGAQHPPDGYLDSTLTQLEFLGWLGLPAELLAEARSGLLIGAGRADPD